MASRTELKATFSGGNQVSESDFALLIDSLAHLSDDRSNGNIIGQSDLTSIQTTMSQLQTLAQLAKDTADGVPSDHPTFTQMQTADNLIKAETLASVNIDTDAIKAVNDAQQIQIANLQTTLDTTTTDLTQDINSLLANQVSVASKADLTYVDSLKASTDSDIAGKAPLVHEHSQYATKVSIADSGYITLADVPPAAQPLHQHNASDINGLNDLFTSPAEVDQKIEAARNTLDNISQLYDIFYDKEEVDQKFYVARWRIDQISLFNPSVVSIAQPLVDLAKTNLEVSIANVRAEEVAKDNAVRSLIASTKAEIEVSIANARFTDEVNRMNSLLARNALQTNIDTVQANATASIASSQAHVLSQLANVRAEVLVETSSNDGDITALQGRATNLETRATNLEAKDTSLDSDISGLQGQINTTNTSVTQTLVDAKAYTDSEIDDLLNGAGAAYDTLKELQDHIVANESSAAQALTTQINNLSTLITGNDNDITALETRATNLETTATNLETKDTSLDGDISNLQNQIITNDTELEALQTFIHGTAGFTPPSSPFPSSNGVIARLDALASQDVTLQNNQNAFNVSLVNFQTTYDNLIASNNTLATAYNDLLARLTTLENTAYAEAGYTFP